jgi:uncharacterized membrane protein
MDRLASALATISTGLLAGAFGYAFFTVVPTFSEIPLNVHLPFRDALMRHNGIYVQILMGLSILTPLWFTYAARDSRIATSLGISASVFSMAAFLVTRFGNVPINQMIKTWSADMPPLGYQDLLNRWLVFHNVRTAAAVASFICITIAEGLRSRSGDENVLSVERIPTARDTR